MDLQKEIERVFDDYMKERNNIPTYAQFLARENPEFLVKWFDTRRAYRGKGVLPEKFKEILLIACNAMRLNTNGIESHIRTAMKMGATKEEIIEAALCVWGIGGLPSLNYILRFFMKILEEQEKI